MTDSIRNLLYRKHILIVGKSQVERRRVINQVIVNIDFPVVRFPAGMKSLYDYVDFVKEAKLFAPWYKAKKYNTNQIMDFHSDWISDSNSLVIMEEVDEWEETWKVEYLRIYIDEIENRKKGEKKIHLLVSQNEENGLIDQLAQKMYVRDNERRTRRQIVEQNLSVITI